MRILTRKDETLNKSFFAVKIAKALVYRKNIFSASETSFRVIFGEADGLPGLIVDKFSDYLVMQITTLGMHFFRSDIISVLADIFQPQGIYAKDNEKSARKEGFAPAVGWVYGLGPEIIPFEMNGICFLADTRGQKTGFFLIKGLMLQQYVFMLKIKPYWMRLPIPGISAYMPCTETLSMLPL